MTNENNIIKFLKEIFVINININFLKNIFNHKYKISQKYF